jgi:predicted enzyme related to lactoylglutathione lyase
LANPVVHWEITGKNAAQLQPFYSSIFGWQIDTNNPMSYGMVNTGGEGINGGIGPSDGPNQVTFYIQVPDLQATLDQVEKLGGRTLIPHDEVPGAGVTLASFADPEGNVIGLIKG